MKIHEYQAIELFRKAGLPVAGGRVASDLTEAATIVKETGFPVVLKAQVLTGGRGKAGGVKLVRDAAELEASFTAIKLLNIKGYAVEKVLVVQAVDIKKEFYAAVTVDNAKNDVVLIVSPEGGVDIEETAKTSPEKIFKFYLNNQKELDPERWPEFVRKIFAEPAAQESATAIFRGLLKAFFDNDCSLAEINPLVIDSLGRWLALDAKINLDDNALYRHPELLSLRDMTYEDPDEITAKEKNLSFVKMEGGVGCIVNGAGLAMATMDVIKLLGGEPANFLDVGGSSSPEKVLNALKIILKNKGVKSILINIFGGITRCDDIARGILQAREQLEIPVPLVVRLTGTNEEEAKQILKENGLETYPSMREAVEQAVQLSKSEHKSTRAQEHKKSSH